MDHNGHYKRIFVYALCAFSYSIIFFIVEKKVIDNDLSIKSLGYNHEIDNGFVNRDRIQFRCIWNSFFITS